MQKRASWSSHMGPPPMASLGHQFRSHCCVLTDLRRPPLQTRYQTDKMVMGRFFLQSWFSVEIIPTLGIWTWRAIYQVMGITCWDSKRWKKIGRWATAPPALPFRRWATDIKVSAGMGSYTRGLQFGRHRASTNLSKLFSQFVGRSQIVRVYPTIQQLPGHFEQVLCGVIWWRSGWPRE